MIDREKFAHGMKRLTASFNRSISEKIIEQWFNELEECNPKVFDSTIETLMKKDHYPNMGEFWATYRECGVSAGIVDKSKRGCEKCCDGYIIFMRKAYKDTDELYEYMGFCRTCWPEKKKYTLDPNRSYDYAVGFEPWIWNAKKNIIPRHVTHGMIQELNDKMKSKGVDWEKETEEAQAFHERAVRNEDHRLAAGGER